MSKMLYWGGENGILRWRGEMGIEVWVSTIVVPPPQRYVSPSVGLADVMSPLVGLVEPIRNSSPDVRWRTGKFKRSKKKCYKCLKGSFHLNNEIQWQTLSYDSTQKTLVHIWHENFKMAVYHLHSILLRFDKRQLRWTK